MAKDNFQKPAIRENLEALAQTIQNIILIEPGTYPNDPNFGCGISNYLFEFNDQTTINEIQSNIDSQISKYAVHPNITVQSSVSTSTAMSGRMNILVIDVNIFDTKTTNTNNETEALNLSYLFAGNTETKAVVSQLIN